MFWYAFSTYMVCSRNVFSMHLVCIQYVFGVYSVCFGMHSACSRYVFSMHLVCNRYVFGMYSVCIWYVISMYLVCNQYVTCSYYMLNYYIYYLCRYNKISESVPSAPCKEILKSLLCQSCSPYAAHLYSFEETGVATSSPGLCRDYCTRIYDTCGAATLSLLSDDYEYSAAVQVRFTCCSLIIGENILQLLM